MPCDANFSLAAWKCSDESSNALDGIHPTLRHVPPNVLYFSIIAVFKTALLIRSTTFLIVYLFLIINYLSIIVLIPFFLVLAMTISTIIISRRESLSELNNSLDNIDSIENIMIN